MTMGSDARNGLWAGPAGRVSILVAAATVTALVPATAAVASGRALTAGDITTVAGGKAPGPAPGTSVAFSPCGVSFAGGFLYAAAGQTVRKISPQGGQLTTPAGTGRFGPLGDGDPATRASLENACGTADAAGNLVIADLNNFRVRVAAALITPVAVALDAAGNLVISEPRGLRVVAVTTGTSYGVPMTAGDVYTVAGAGAGGDGGPAITARITQPQGVALDAAGNVVIAESGDRRIRVIAVTTGTFYGQAMTADDIYTVAGQHTAGFAGDGGPGTSAELNGPRAVAVTPAGDLVIADSQNSRIRAVAG